MENRPLSEELHRYLGVAWHWAWMIILIAGILGGSAYLISSRSIPIFRASTRLLVNEAPATRSADYASLLTSERLAQTYTELLGTKPVLEAVIEQLDLELSVEALRSALTAQAVPDTELIDVSYRDSDPNRAALIANTVVQVFKQQNQEIQSRRYQTSKESLSRQLSEVDAQIQAASAALESLGSEAAAANERDHLEATMAMYRQSYASLLQTYEQVRLAESTSTSNVIPIEPALPPSKPISPRPLRTAGIATAIGILLSIGIVVLIEALDDTLAPDSVTRQLGLPILGFIARFQPGEGKPVVSEHPRSPVSEAFRSLRTNIQFASVDRPIHTLLITSPSPEDGKSTVSVNLGVSLAQAGQSVVILDADLRRPQIHKKLALSNTLGLTSVFVKQQVLLNGAVQSTGIENLSAITAGNLPPNPAELLASAKMSEILQQVTKQADLTIIDTPPIMAVTDAAALSSRVDGVILVVKPGKTTLAAARQAIEQLNRVGANILGLVLNDVLISRSLYKYSYYRSYYSAYHKYYGAEAEPATAQ